VAALAFSVTGRALPFFWRAHVMGMAVISYDGITSRRRREVFALQISMITMALAGCSYRLPGERAIPKCGWTCWPTTIP